MNSEEKILEMLSAMQTNMASMQADMAAMQADLSGVKADLSGVKADLSGVKDDLSGVKANMAAMQNDMAALTERVDRIDDRSLRTVMLIENEITPKLNLLYEGHEAILERLEQTTPKSQTKALEEDVTLLKDAFKLMR